MRRLSGLAYVYIFIIIFILVQIVTAVPMRFLSSKLVPLAVAIPLFVVAVIGLVREVRARGGDADAEIDEGEGGIAPKQHGLRAYLPITGWVVGFAVGIYVLGLLVAIPLFIVGYMKTHEIGWRTSLIAAGLTAVSIWALFEVVLYIELYRGLLLDALGI